MGSYQNKNQNSKIISSIYFTILLLIHFAGFFANAKIDSACPLPLESAGLVDLIDDLDVPDFTDLTKDINFDPIPQNSKNIVINTLQNTAQKIIQTNIKLFRKYVYKYETGEQTRGGQPMSIIKKDGYNATNYTTVTSDGYILSLQRIFPLGYNSSGPEKDTKTVFLGHGLLGSSADWLMVDKGRSLPYLLANAGYDVWMGNARGNYYSRGHTKDTPEKKYFHNNTYWNYSVHEMGHLDLPKLIDKILEVTKVEKINYIGYSMSTTYFHIMLSAWPEYNDKFHKVVALAPAVYASNMISPTKCLLGIHKNIRMLVYIGYTRVAYYGISAINEASPSGICGTRGSYQFCYQLMQYLAGPSSEPNRTVLGYAQYYFPTVTSARTVEHYIQYFRKPLFRRYNYGKTSNKKYYNGLEEPPMYNLGNSRVNMKVFYGKTDHLTVVKDVEKTIRELQQREGVNIQSQMIQDKNGKFNHLDFYYHDKAIDLVYKPLIRYLDGDEKS